jgi:hypothetical protein
MPEVRGRFLLIKAVIILSLCSLAKAPSELLPELSDNIDKIAT